jgi:predicted ribosome quality control (RQC) complex YloA/Tae2 family protein
MSAAIDYANQLKGVKQDSSRQQLIKLVNGEITKLERKRRALDEELADAEAAADWREFADVLMANLYAVPSGITCIELPNYQTEDASTLVIPLDPDKSPVENAQAFYAKYNKLKRARQAVAEQLQQCIEEIKYLQSISCALELASLKADIAEIRDELITAGYIQIRKKRQPLAAQTQFLTAVTPNGVGVLIGKNNRQNDIVTFKKARADDIWLHTKDIPGSHVILQTGSTEPTAADLTAAAQLAAYFSKAQNSSNVPVDYTRRRYVKKPAGAKPGFVTFERQRTIFITPEASIIGKLLKNQSK